ncbi:MAG: DUF2059 domain-containing protein [Burkholderiaceae bacterium]
MLACLSFACVAAPTSDASIETLLTLTKSENTLNAAYEQIVPVTTQSIPQALAGKTLSTQQPQGVETAVQQAVEVMRTELSSWASVRPDVMKIYQGTFLQEEVDGMIAFYRSPPGIAVVEKLPTVMQRSNAFAMARMPSIVAKVNAATKKTMADIKPIQ